MAKRIFEITPNHLTFEIIQDILENDVKLQLSEISVQLIHKSKRYLDDKLECAEKPLYGINTGFGSLCNIEISKGVRTIMKVYRRNQDARKNWGHPHG